MTALRQPAFAKIEATLNDWSRDLIARMERAQVCMELVGLSRERQDELIREANALKRCQVVLAAMIESEAA